MSTFILEKKWELSSVFYRIHQRFMLIQFWIERHRQRKALAQLDADLLMDLGLDENQVRQEVNKPFWK